MATNLIRDTFNLAESAIEQEPSKRSATVTALPTPTTTPIIRPSASAAKVTKQALEVDGNVDTKSDSYKIEIDWRNIVFFSVIHSATIYGFYLVITRSLYLEYILAHLIGMLGIFGITAGVHRLWAHKSYKAKWQLRSFLMILQTISFQKTIYEWVCEHRAHHKFCDTHGDPYNARRGFFFSHIGWLMCKKHPDAEEKIKMIDMSDIEADPIVMFQKKYYWYLMPVFCFILPTMVPYYVLGATLTFAFLTSIMKYVVTLHITFLVNSAAHMYGMRPFDKSISPSENKLVAWLTIGEGWHNYHHVFPWDYKTAELGGYMYNFSTAIINLFAKIGWAYDLKTVSNDMILKRAARTGEGSYVAAEKGKDLVAKLNENHNHDELESKIWGWGDRDMPEDDKIEADILNKVD